MCKKISLIFTALLIVLIASACSTKQEAVDVVEKYLDEKSWQEKQKFVVDVEGLKNEPYYVPHKYEFSHVWKTDTLDSQHLRLHAVVKQNDWIYPFVVKKIGDDYKIDIKATVGYNEMTLREYEADRPDTVVLRVQATFERGFENVIAVCLDSFYPEAYQIHAIAKKDSKFYSDLRKLLKSGMKQEVILKLIPFNSYDWYKAEIVDLVKKDWIMDK